MLFVRSSKGDQEIIITYSAGRKIETGDLKRAPVSVGSGRLCGAIATLCLQRGMSAILNSQDNLIASAY